MYLLACHHSSSIQVVFFSFHPAVAHGHLVLLRDVTNSLIEFPLFGFELYYSSIDSIMK
jgi:hypothetical protein